MPLYGRTQSGLLLPETLGGPIIGTSVAASVSFITAPTDNFSRTVYTFSSIVFPAAYIVVATGTIDISPGPDVSSVTIDGNTATEHVNIESDAGGAAVRTTLHGFDMSGGGATGDVVVTYSTGTIRCGIGVWSIADLDSTTPTATDSDTASTGSVACNVNAGGVAIVATNHWISGSPATVTFGNEFVSGDEDYDNQFDSNQTAAGASKALASADTPLTVSITPASAATLSAHAMATWS